MYKSMLVQIIIHVHAYMCSEFLYIRQCFSWCPLSYLYFLHLMAIWIPIFANLVQCISLHWSNFLKLTYMSYLWILKLGIPDYHLKHVKTANMKFRCSSCIHGTVNLFYLGQIFAFSTYLDQIKIKIQMFIDYNKLYWDVGLNSILKVDMYTCAS